MSMTMLTILEFIIMFVLYSGITIVVPYLYLRKKIVSYSLTMKLLICYMVGNFYIMNLVFILELLHISYRITLIIGTLMPFIILLVKKCRGKMKSIIEAFLDFIHKLAGRRIGIKTLLYRWFSKFGSWFWSNIKGFFKNHTIDAVLVLATLALILWIFGSNALNSYGYGASDIPVHNYWINALSDNKLFVAGVYPMGFHAIIYFIHAVFGMPTYVLLRLFWLVQVIYIVFMIVAFLKVVCKTRFIAYVGSAIYVGTVLFPVHTYSRFYSSLPQEYGMIFILPSALFAIEFFRQYSIELKNRKEKKDKPDKKESRRYLMLFAISFSMTLAVHFYNTMIAGLFCVGIAAGFFFRFFRWRYFKRIMLTGIISVIIAAAPMVIAFVCGTPLQGSLGWGMSVINGGNNSDDEESEEDSSQNTEAAPITTDNMQNTEAVQDIDSSQIEKIASDVNVATPEPVVQVSIKDKVKIIFEKMFSATDEFVVNPEGDIYTYAVFGIIAILAVLPLIFFIARKTDYGAVLLSLSGCMFLVMCLQSAGKLGLPQLMDGARCSIFFTYLIPVGMTLIIDAALYILFGWIKWKWIMNFTSFAMIICIICLALNYDMIREPRLSGSLESNEAIMCVANILRDNKGKDGTWTICSANDELRMTEEYGYHEETISFLRKIEYVSEYSQVTIPTHMLYFFIEKDVINYAGVMGDYNKIDHRVSAEWAKEAVPNTGGLDPYMRTNRMIVMSRMYYWAQEFMKLFPDDMEVYFENDDFVCYAVEQEDYALFNLAIDYGYNTVVE